MKLVPTFDRIVVKPDARKDRTAGGILLPDTVKDKPLSGTVVAVGPGKYEGGVLVPVSIEAGSRVFFPKLAGSEIETLDGKFLIMHACDVLAIEKEN